MRAAAEGLETAGQLATLRGLDCDYGQGFFFSRPVDPQAAGQLIASEQRW
jgi:EAL domain-containing protein (putative c-di-GMP-specific phosphodiesterase class I)